MPRASIGLLLSEEYSTLHDGLGCSEVHYTDSAGMHVLLGLLVQPLCL